MPPITPTKPTEPKLYAYGEDVIVDGKNVGQAKFNSRTGAALEPKVSTTTVSNVNKIDQIPGMVSNLNKMADRGVRTDTATGLATYADGSVAEDPAVAQKRKDDLAKIEQQRAEALKQQQTGGVVDTNTQLNLEREKINLQQDQMLSDMKANLDSETKALIDSIQQNFQRKREEQARINEKQEKGLQAGLLTGGVTGKGSRAQFTSQGSATNVMAAQENASLQKLKQLDDDERAAIAAAKAAQNAGNFEILVIQLAAAEARHQEKVQAATKLNEKIAADNAKLQERNMAATRDNAVASLYEQGITDVPSLLAELNKAGGKFTSKEIKETLDNLVPPGLDDLVTTLRTNGAPQETIQAVLKSGNINDAYNAAGNWAAGGAGIIGEYNYAVANGYTGSFSDYQNEDANRKVSIAKAGAAQYGGYDTAQQKAIDQINTSVGNNPNYKKLVSMQTFINNVDSALSQNSGIGDIAAINQFQKVIDEGAVTRDQDVKLIQGAQSLASSLKLKIKKLEKGQQLAPEQRQQIKQLTQQMLDAQKKALEKDPGIAAQKKKAERYKVDLTETALGEVGANPADEIVENNNKAKAQIDALVVSNPKNLPKVIDLTTKGFSNAKILEYLQLQGK